MKYISIILTFILLQACLPFQLNEMSAEEAEMKIYNEWLYAFKLQNLKVNNEVISRPPGIELLLFSLVIPTEGGISLKTHCVYYQVPYKKIPGHLKIVEQKNDSTCPEISGENPWFELKGITNLKVNLLNFKLGLNFQYQNLNKSWTFLIPNITNGPRHEKFQAAKEQKHFPQLTFLRINSESFNLRESKYLGKISDRVGHKSAIRCLQVAKDCQTVGEDRCDSCSYGWYEVVDYSCPQGGSKFCGQNHCGEKNEPACPRGKKTEDNTDAGICQSDLSAVLNADHILICQ